MSLYDRVRAFFAPKDERALRPDDATDDADTRGPKDAPPRAAPPPREGEEPGDLRVLSALAHQAGDPTGSLGAFRALRGTPHERAALRAVLVAHEARHVDEALLVEAAALLVARGDPGPAIGLLAELGSLAALTVRAEAEERAGDQAAARRTLERVLALDIDAVGVRARLDRLRERAGLSAVVPLNALPTMTTAEETRASYRIVAELGRGGASAVFRAEDILLGRTLALKVFHRPREQRAQLLREAELAVRARGAHVVRVFDADPDQGFLAMELCEGGALRRVLRAARETDAHARFVIEDWLTPLVGAVGRVHAIGLVHGDIKAGNVLFRRDGTPVLADFGLARAPGEPYEGGTPGTLSPERLRDGVAHPDDDVFALGALVEEALDRGVGSRAGSAIWRETAARWKAPRGDRPGTALDLRFPGA